MKALITFLAGLSAVVVAGWVLLFVFGGVPQLLTQDALFLLFYAGTVDIALNLLSGMTRQGPGLLPLDRGSTLLRSLCVFGAVGCFFLARDKIPNIPAAVAVPSAPQILLVLVAYSVLDILVNALYKGAIRWQSPREADLSPATDGEDPPELEGTPLDITHRTRVKLLRPVYMFQQPDGSFVQAEPGAAVRRHVEGYSIPRLLAPALPAPRPARGSTRTDAVVRTPPPSPPATPGDATART